MPGKALKSGAFFGAFPVVWHLIAKD